MLVDGMYLQNSTTEKNIKTITLSESVLCEKRICELSELALDAALSAQRLFYEGYGIYEILGVISGAVEFDRSTIHSEAMKENLSRLSSYLSSINAQDTAVFSDFFVYQLKKLGITIMELDFLADGGGDETFVYVKNRLADEAYDVFSQEFDDPRVFYAQSFREAARAVSQGSAEYCLLPLEEHGGARLPSVAAILFAEDLKINSVTPVFGFDGNADMKYALASRHFTVPEVEGDDDRYLEIRLNADSSALSALFAVADHLHVSVYRVNTISFDTEDGSVPYFTAVFRKNGADFTSFLVYLTLFCPSYTAVGIYNNLE